MKLGEPVYPPQFYSTGYARMLEEGEWLDTYVASHEVINFVIGDGLAFYEVVRPDTLRPILALDGLEVHPALIRGITLEEVELELIRMSNTGMLRRINRRSDAT